MPGTTNERRELKHKYFSKTWSQKVDAMTDRQVIAIYLRFKAQGAL